MAGYPPKKGVAFSYEQPVFASDGSYRTGASFSASQVSKDGGTFATTTNPPAEIGASGLYTISLTATEMNADRVTTRFVPSTALTQSAGAEILTDSAQIGELVRSTTPANTLDVSATGEAGLDFNNIKDATGAHTLTNIRVPNVTLADTTTALTNAPPNSAGVATLLTRIPQTLLFDAAGNIKAALYSILGTAITESIAGHVAAAFTYFFNVNAPSGTVNGIPTNLPGGTGGLPLFEDILTADDTRTALGLANPNLDSQFTNLALLVQDVPGQVWDVDLSQHLNAGSTGEALNDATSGSAPTVQQIVDGVWDEPIADHEDAGSTGETLFTAGAGAGTGFYTVEIPCEVSGQPADGVAVRVTSDSAGANVIAQATSNSLGIAIVYLDAGTYYAFLQRGGDTFPNPTTLTIP